MNASAISAKIFGAWKQTAVQASAILFGIAALVYFAIAERGVLTEGDTLFHYKIATLILEGAPWVDIRWLPFTILGDHGPDHQWFWHLALAPFALIPDAWNAILVASAATCGIAAAVGFLVFRNLGIPYAAFFSICLLMVGTFMPERMTRLRCDTLAYPILLLALLLLVRSRHIGLALLSFIFMQSYHGAILLIPMVGMFMLASVSNGQALTLKPLLAVLIGVFTGLIASPWFPDNIHYLIFHLMFKAGMKSPHLVGTEWYPQSWLQILVGCWQVHLLLATGIAAFVFRRLGKGGTSRLAAETITALLLSALTLVMYHSSWRNSVYYSLFGVIAAGLLWRDSGVVRNINRRTATAVSLACVAICASLLWAGYRQIANAPGYGLDRFSNIAAYLREHAKPGEMVFNTSWDTFPELLWQNDSLRYVSGLDGNYLRLGDPERFKLWYGVASGTAITAGTPEILRKTFNAQWVVVPRSPNSDQIAMKLLDAGGAQTIVLDDDGWLIRIQ